MRTLLVLLYKQRQTYVEEMPSGTLGAGAFLVRGRPLSKMSSSKSSSSLSSDSNKLGKGKFAVLIFILTEGTPKRKKEGKVTPWLNLI